MAYFEYLIQEIKKCKLGLLIASIIHISYLYRSKPELFLDYKYWLTYIGWSLVGLIGALSIKWYYRNV